jgi:hypothetical protein
MALIPSNVQAVSNYNWVSSLDLTTNVHKPSIDTELVKRYGNQNITGFMEMQGSMNPVAALQYQHFEEDRIHTIVKVVAQAGGAAGASVTLTVAAAYQYTFPTTPQSPYIVALPSTVTNPLRENDIIMFPNGVEAKVTSRTSTTFLATPTQSGDAIPVTTASTEIIIIGNSWEEQTDQPASRNSRVNRYQNNLMIVKGTHTVSGSEMNNALWFEVKDPNGKSGFLWYFKGQMDEYQRFMNEREMMMLLGKKITNTTLATIQPTDTITEGLIPFIENYGNVYNYSGVTGIQLADFEQMIVSLDKQRGAKENSLWCGISLSQGVDQFMRDTMKNGAISYGAFGGSKEKAINFNFSSFELTGYTFHKKTYDLFNDPTLLGANGFPYQYMGLVIPSDNVGASFEPGAKTKTTVPSLRLNYSSGQSAGNGYSRQVEEWLTGAVNGIYTNSTDQLQYNLRSHMGFEGFAPNRFFQLKKA